MQFHATLIDGVTYIELDPIRDERGFFARAWDLAEFGDRGLAVPWVQANIGHNTAAGTLRGLHFQRGPHAEHKLVRCTSGRLQDVAVDLRHESPTYGRWVSFELTAERGAMLLIPPGCAHGYLTLEPQTDIFYFTSAAYHRPSAGGVRHDDPVLGIEWNHPIAVISEQDREWPLLPPSE